MSPVEAQRSLRSIAAVVRRIPCRGCGAHAEAPCPGSPVGHAWRLNDAFTSPVTRDSMPRNSEAFYRIFAAAYPITPDGDPETTAAGKTVLWRAAPSAGAWFGRGSYWTHDKGWARGFARVFELGRVEPTGMQYSRPPLVPYAVYRAEVTISDLNSCWHDPEDDGQIRVTKLNRNIRDYPDWPARSWLLFSVPIETLEPGKLVPLTHYVYCGQRPIKAEQDSA
ncbi:MAG: hypothetical protein JWM19_7545 [Actinomycetia bacterium]|nr:hypothetical protein [Actinomycetes bacterium]